MQSNASDGATDLVTLKQKRKTNDAAAAKQGSMPSKCVWQAGYLIALQTGKPTDEPDRPTNDLCLLRKRATGK